jgi:hypothetical protein
MCASMSTDSGLLANRPLILVAHHLFSSRHLSLFWSCAAPRNSSHVVQHGPSWVPTFLMLVDRRSGQAAPKVKPLPRPWPSYIYVHDNAQQPQNLCRNIEPASRFNSSCSLSFPRRLTATPSRLHSNWSDLSRVAVLFLI